MNRICGRQIPNELSESSIPSAPSCWCGTCKRSSRRLFNKDALIRNAPPLIAAAAKVGREDRVHPPDAVSLERGGGLPGSPSDDQREGRSSEQVEAATFERRTNCKLWNPSTGAEDIVIDKRRPSMFVGNEFETIMHNLGATPMVMIGCTPTAASR